MPAKDLKPEQAATLRALLASYQRRNPRTTSHRPNDLPAAKAAALYINPDTFWRESIGYTFILCNDQFYAEDSGTTHIDMMMRMPSLMEEMYTMMDDDYQYRVDEYLKDQYKYDLDEDEPVSEYPQEVRGHELAKALFGRESYEMFSEALRQFVFDVPGIVLGRAGGMVMRSGNNAETVPMSMAGDHDQDKEVGVGIAFWGSIVTKDEIKKTIQHLYDQAHNDGLNIPLDKFRKSYISVNGSFVGTADAYAGLQPGGYDPMKDREAMALHLDKQKKQRLLKAGWKPKERPSTLIPGQKYWALNSESYTADLDDIFN